MSLLLRYVSVVDIMVTRRTIVLLVENGVKEVAKVPIKKPSIEYKEATKVYGSWMIVQRRTRKPTKKQSVFGKNAEIHGFMGSGSFF